MERSEFVTFNIKTDKGSEWVEKNLPNLADRIKYDCPPGDTLSITYSINIEYFGLVAAILNEILRAKDSLEVTARELTHGRSLIIEIANSLSKFES